MNDFIRPFILSEGLFKGLIVRAGEAMSEIEKRKHYPEPVAELLAESVILTALLSSSLKYNGVFTLQTKADGPVKTLVCDQTSNGEIRAYARFDEEEIKKITVEELKDRGSVPVLLKSGVMSFTIDENDASQRYQATVELEGLSLSECAHKYFQQSEQIETAIKIAAKAPAKEDEQWQCAGMMLQRMPLSGGKKIAEDTLDVEKIDDEWNTDVILMGSLTDKELLDSKLSEENILYRLYHEQEVRLFDKKPLRFACRCSAERIRSVLKSFSEQDLNDIMKDGKASVTCEFCGNTYEIKKENLSNN